MSGKTVNSAILLLVIGNALALVSDVFIKLLEPGAPIFQFAFVRSLLTLVLLLPLWHMVDTSRLFQGFGVHLLRAHIHLVGMICMVVALITLPLATANALFYAAPILVMVFSVVFFRERLTPLSILAVVSGFAGIIVILRPVELGWGALSALAAAATLALNAVLVRKLPRTQSTVRKLILNYVLILPGADACGRRSMGSGHTFQRRRLRTVHSGLQRDCFAGLPAGRSQSGNQRRIHRADLGGFLWLGGVRRNARSVVPGRQHHDCGAAGSAEPAPAQIHTGAVFHRKSCRRHNWRVVLTAQTGTANEARNTGQHNLCRHGGENQAADLGHDVEAGLAHDSLQVT